VGRRRGAIALALLAAGLAIYVFAGRGSELSYAGPAAPSFSLRYDGLRRVAPGPGELARLEESSGGLLERRLTVEPLALSGRPDPVSTALPFLARRFEDDAARRYPGYAQRVEGRTRLGIIDGREAYMVGFTARALGPVAGAGAGRSPGGGLWIGKMLLIAVPGDAPRGGIALQMLERVRSGKVAIALRRAPAGFLANWPSRFWVQQRTAVDAPTSLEQPLHSLTFG
jgi:hypothetical protein